MIKGALKKTLDVVADEAKKTGQVAKQQVTGVEKEMGKKGEKQEAPKQAAPTPPTAEMPSTDDIVKSFYAESKPKTPEEKKQQEIIEKAQKQHKTPEEIQKLDSLRQQLHKDTYYDPTFNRTQQQEEERPAEKVEREKMEDLQMEHEKKQKAPPPLAVSQAQNIEKNRGSAG